MVEHGIARDPWVSHALLTVDGLTELGSRKHFDVGFDSFFPEVHAEARERIAGRLYVGVRNGMYHDAITSAGIAAR
jgi:hypothetical protein